LLFDAECGLGKPMRWVSIVLALMLVGCADLPMGNVRVNLAELSRTPTNLAGGNSRQVIVVSPFTDARPVGDRCGIERHLLDTRCGAFVGAEPGQLIASMLAAELKAAGFSVVTEATASKPSALRIEGTLIKMFTEIGTLGFNEVAAITDIHVKLVATSKTGLRAERYFYVQGSSSSSFMLGASNYKESAQEAAGKVLKSMVVAILSLANQYPQLGSRAGPDSPVGLALLQEDSR
jgi:hypothetical protein